MKSIVTAMLAGITATSLLAVDIRDTRLLTDPAVSADHIAFAYANDLWVASLDGSNVTIGYVDEGVLNTDPTGHLSGRVNETACGTAGLAGTGHGHFGASNAGGACPHTGESGTGFRFGLGVAPSVNFINLPSLNASGNCFTNISDSSALARLTVTSNGPVNGVPGAVQNNSWGSGSGDNAEDVLNVELIGDEVIG